MDPLSWSLVSLAVLLIILAAKDAWDWHWIERDLTRQHREELWREYAAERWGRR